MRHPDRPYRWGNWITVGLITGQLVGMFSSPLHVEADLRDVGALLATVVAPGPAQVLPTIEVHLGLAPDRTDAEPGPGPGSDDRGADAHREVAQAAPLPGTSPPSTASSSPSAATASTDGTAAGPGGTGDGASGSTTTGRPPTSTRPGTTAAGPSTTAVGGSTTTDPDELGLSSARRPCEVAADVRSSWLVTVAPGPFDRLAVLAVLAGLPDDRLVSRSDTSWLADASAGHLCLVARLPGVIDVTELPPAAGTSTTGTPGAGTTSVPTTTTTARTEPGATTSAPTGSSTTGATDVPTPTPASTSTSTTVSAADTTTLTTASVTGEDPAATTTLTTGVTEDTPPEG